MQPLCFSHRSKLGPAHHRCTHTLSCNACEGSSPDVAAIFNRRAATYDESAPHQWQAEIAADMAAPQPHERVLDVACGTGLAARACAARMATDVAPGQICGVDISDGMLEVARGALPSAKFVNAHAAQLPFDKAAFDVLICIAALPYICNKGAALAEWRRVLRSDGRLIVNVPADDGITVFALLRKAAAEHGVTLAQPAGGLGTADTLQQWLTASGCTQCSVRSDYYAEPLRPQEDSGETVAWRYVDAGFAGPLKAAPQAEQDAVLAAYRSKYAAACKEGIGGHTVLTACARHSA